MFDISIETNTLVVRHNGRDWYFESDLDLLRVHPQLWRPTTLYFRPDRLLLGAVSTIEEVMPYLQEYYPELLL